MAKAIECTKQDASREVMMDAMAIARFKQDSEAQLAILATMALRGEADIQRDFLQCLRRRSVSGNPAENKKRKPLAGFQLDLMLASYDAVDSEPIVANQATQLVGVSAGSQGAALIRLSALPQQPRAMQIQTPQQHMVLSQKQSAAQKQFAARSAMSQIRPNNLLPPAKSNRIRSEGYVRTVVNELRFAGESARAKTFLEGQIESSQTEFKLRSLCEYLFRCERFDEVEGPLLRWFEVYQRCTEDGGQAATQEDSTPTEFAARFLNANKEKSSLRLGLQLLDLAIANSNVRFRKRELSLLSVSSLTATPETMTAIGPSKQPIQMPVFGSHFVSEDLCFLFDSVRSLYRRENRFEDWDSYLKQRVFNADGDTKPLERLRQTLHSSVPAKLDGNNFALVSSLEELGQQPECALHSAAALLALKRYDTSRNLAQKFNASDPQEELLRELVVLRASAGLLDHAQLESSMKFINTQNLDSAAMSCIIMSLQNANRLNLLQQSQIGQARTRSTTNMISSVVAGPSTVRTSTTFPGSAGTNTADFIRIKDLMEAQNSGQIETAIRIAKQIVSKPRVFPPLEVLRQPPQIRNWSVTRISIPLSRSSSKTTLVASLPETRDFAFHFLKERGAMKDLIEEVNKLLADAPDSFKQLELLAEYYEINGDTKLSIETTLRALRLRPSSSPLRMHFAERLSALGDSSAACDQHLELIRHDPNNGLLSVSKNLADFNESDRIEDLKKAVRAANFQSIVDRDYLLAQSIGMLENAKHFEVGLALLEKLSDLDPTLRQQALRMVYGTLNPVNPAFLPFAIAGFIPNENDVAVDPWVGLEDESTFFGNDQSPYLLEWVLRNHSQEDIAKSLAPAIEEAVDRMPGWFAGSVFLTMIAEHIDTPENAQKRIGALASNRRLLEDCPDGVALCVAKMFLPYPEYRHISYRMIEPLIGK